MPMDKTTTFSDMFKIRVIWKLPVLSTMGKQVTNFIILIQKILTENRPAAPQLHACQNTHWLSSVKHSIKMVICPKLPATLKLTSWISEFGKDDLFSTENKILFCNLCQCTKKSLWCNNIFKQVSIRLTKNAIPRRDNCF